MAFWQSSDLEPKRSYRFQLSVAGADNKLEEFLIEKVNKPSFTISESEVKYLNHTFYYPGRVTWNEISFTIIDVLGQANATARIMLMLEGAGYDIPTAADTSTISKRNSQEALGEVMIHQFRSSGGRPIETWVLNNAWIQEVKFGDLDYGSEDMQKVDVTLKYDNAYIKLAASEGGGGGNFPTGQSG